jgi:galactokinase/galacturonokinase
VNAAFALDALRAKLALEEGVDAGSIRGVLSPYRLCPLGAHSDHQHGPVLGVAVDLYSTLAFAPAKEPVVHVASAHHPERLSIDLREPQDAGDGTVWTRYARGAVEVLRDRLPPQPVGLHARVEGALPGGGLSSSASVVTAYLMALAHVNGVLLSEQELVILGRRVENEHVGVACGILDPASIVGSRAGCLLAIDTAASRWEPVPLGRGAPKTRWLVVYTGRSRSLAHTGFNDRVAECHEAARMLARLAGVRDAVLLGKLPDAVFEAHLSELPEPHIRRARHFRTERARVGQGLECWRAGDLEAFGELMKASCESSISDYETGSPELVRLQEIFCETPGVLGARFSGAGFGGCGIALVAEEEREEAARSVLARFREACPELAQDARTFLVESVDGARVV